MREASAERLDRLTGLRFFAAFGVLLCHYAPVLRLPPDLRFLTDFLGSGVALFFVLSGFVLTHTYERRLDAPPGPGRRALLRQYAVARIARIVPVYWLCLLALLALYLAFGFGLSLGGGADEPRKAFTFVVNLLALQAWWPDYTVQQYWNAPGWSISSELFFYAMFPWLLRVRWLDGSARQAVLLWAAMAAALLLYLGAALATGAGPAWLAYPIRLPLMGLYCFVLGMQLARARRHGRMPVVSSRAMALAAVALVPVAWLVFLQSSRHALGFFVETCVTYLVYTPFYYLLLAWLLRPGPQGAALARPRLVLLGEASYALYLLHWLPLTVLTHGPAALRESALAAWGVALGLPLLSIGVFRWFEDPLRAALRRMGPAVGSLQART